MKTPEVALGLRILLVDDEPDVDLATGEVLRDAGHHVDHARDGELALRQLLAHEYDLMLCDVRLPGMDGLSLFRKAREQRPDLVVILVTAFAQIQDAIAAVKEGADDYLTKPLDSDEIVLRVARIAEDINLRRQLAEARNQLAALDRSEPIVGRSPIMCRMRDRLNTIAGSDAPVLLIGETGTGKELVARALHDRSSRQAKPFVAVNCAAFPDSLLEAELFGHERGAFTGAIARREGRFRAAHGGTLLLDEVGDMSPAAQAKLLRVLQEHVIEPLGTNTSVAVDVRVISATHRDLRSMMKDGRFREDLYYRLNVLSIDVPALRDRQGDLPVLAHYFLQKFRKPGQDAAQMTLAAWTALAAFPFPGNVRQLGHAIERALVLAAGGTIDVHHLPGEMTAGRDPAKVEPAVLQSLSVATREFEKHYLQRALAESDGKRAVAAKALGISRKNLWEKLRGHNDADEVPAT